MRDSPQRINSTVLRERGREKAEDQAEQRTTEQCTTDQAEEKRKQRRHGPVASTRPQHEPDGHLASGTGPTRDAGQLLDPECCSSQQPAEHSTAEQAEQKTEAQAESW
ncbi:unnamed protein product [Phytophthora lilii]|uniref:Unnamed protein product n=1 Tax=Phytophthora lilii TaxID=2077276 RepID=A0A9W6UA85_9STRA|nr:unnamed protein product [Phytophthora lilii]